jgi:CBS domain-containing protein
MNSIGQFLTQRIQNIHSVSPQSTVRQALELMAEKNIGALLVLEENQLVGMFSERDYARKVVLQGKSSIDTLVQDIMTTKVICIKVSQTFTECMQTMTDHHIRHLPVMNEQNVIGLISIGDVVKEILEEQTRTIEQLKSYIVN